MINYVVQPGDMIGVLAVKYKTTIRTLMTDNPSVKSDQKLTPGTILKIYTPEENAKRHTETAYHQIEKASRLKSKIRETDYMLSEPREPVYYKEREVYEGQIAFGKTIKETPLIEIQANGFEKIIRMLPKGEIVRIYQTTSYNGGMFLINNYQWITSNSDYVLYDEIPQYELDGKIDLRYPKIQNNFMMTARAAPVNYIGSGKQQATSKLLLKPQSMIGSGKSINYANPDGLSSIPQFERPSNKRPVLIMRNAKGQSTTVELRVLGFQAAYSNTVQASTTNDGWMINVRGAGLPTLSISGFLLETKAANEFNDFMTRYHQYLQAAKSGDYYSMGISTLFYKKTEYRGVFTSFSYSDTEDASLHRKYTLTMMVLKEKTMDSKALRAVPEVVSRQGKSEKAFRTDIGAMLANPITGKYYTDF